MLLERQRQTVHVSIVQHFSEIQGMYKCDFIFEKKSVFRIVLCVSTLHIYKMRSSDNNECISCAELRVFLSEGPFYHESVVIHSYILVHQIWQEITTILGFLANLVFFFLDIKCQLSNTLKHVYFEKMPRS